jgi:hypothetical protein
MYGGKGALPPKTGSQGVMKRSPSNESWILNSSLGEKPIGLGMGTATSLSWANLGQCWPRRSCQCVRCC